jgi:hypothetical protein
MWVPGWAGWLTWRSAAGQGAAGGGDAGGGAHPDGGVGRRRPPQPGAVRAVRGPAGAAFCQLLLAYAELQLRGPSGDAVRLVVEADATFAELGDPWGEAFASFSRFAMESYGLGLPDRAVEAAQRALERFQALDDQWGLA